MTPEFKKSLEEELNQNYEWAADIAERQRILNRERDRQESDRDVLLIELGRIGVQGYDVT